MSGATIIHVALNDGVLDVRRCPERTRVGHGRTLEPARAARYPI